MDGYFVVVLVLLGATATQALRLPKSGVSCGRGAARGRSCRPIAECGSLTTEPIGACADPNMRCCPHYRLPPEAYCRDRVKPCPLISPHVDFEFQDDRKGNSESTGEKRVGLGKEFPFMVLTGIRKTSGQVEWLCGGTLINEDYVLTAAHCTREEEEGWVKFSSGEETRGSVIRHPGYKDMSRYHDLALLRLDIGSSLGGVCLHSGHRVPFATATAPLWVDRPSLRVVGMELKMVNQTECQRLNSGDRLLPEGVRQEGMLCARWTPTGRQSCPIGPGDALLMKKSTDCHYTLVGLASLPHHCQGAAVYTRVSHYLPWIQSVAWAKA